MVIIIIFYVPHQPGRVAEVLVPVAELRVADVGVTILVHGVPAVTELQFNHDYQRCLHYILFMFLLKQSSPDSASRRRVGTQSSE